jgi:AcrR family transcriptional regulator
MRSTAIKRQVDRREEILAAAQRCFSRSGFHQSSMQEICAEADMSPGGLYRYFPSKEAIIAAIAERDRADAAANFAAVAEVPGVFEGLEKLARIYLIERSDEEIGVCAEIRTESRRNPEVGRIHHSINADVEAAARFRPTSTSRKSSSFSFRLETAWSGVARSIRSSTSNRFFHRSCRWPAVF